MYNILPLLVVGVIPTLILEVGSILQKGQIFCPNIPAIIWEHIGLFQSLLSFVGFIFENKIMSNYCIDKNLVRVTKKQLLSK